MKRDLVLEEVFSFFEYNQLRSGRGVPELSSETSSSGKNIRHFVTREQVSYPDINTLIADVPDEIQSFRTVWPIGFISGIEARNYTRNNSSDYFSWLIEIEPELEQLAVGLNMDPSRRSATDDLNFYKHDGLWSLDSFCINNRNFKFYTFNGVQPLSKNQNPSAHVLYLPEDVDIPLVTPNQQEAKPNI